MPMLSVASYSNPKLETKLSYLTMFICQVGHLRSTKLTFGLLPIGDILQRKIDRIFRNLNHYFGISDDIVMITFDENGLMTIQHYQNY